MNLKACCLFLWLSLFFSPVLTYAESIDVSGAVSGNWIVDTVNVVGNIEIRAAETLHIDPGVTVLFNGSYYFRVSGGLEAMGESENPIIFTINDTTGFHNDTLATGGWNQIRIENQSLSVDTIRFYYCHFEFGKAVAADSVHGYGGALCIRNSDRVAITNCSFSNNYAYFSGGAVYLENASVLINSNNFNNNNCGQTQVYYGYGGGLCSDSSNAIIEKNYFNQNSSTGIGGGLCIRFSDCPVLLNIFEDNFSALGGGFGMLHIDTCRFVISNNLVVNNGAQFFGAGISNGDCSPTYVNNTIVNNACMGGGGGFYCKDSVVPILYNNIIYGNTQYGGEINQVYLWDILSQPDFYYNNIQGGSEGFAGTGSSDFTGEYMNNISADPLFGFGTYTPALESPCVNAGCVDTTGLMVPAFDLAGNTRIVEDTIDMGAFEQQDLAGIGLNEISESLHQLHVYPNPAAADVQIDFNLQSSQFVTLFVADMQGRMVDVICVKNMEAGRQNISWNLGNLMNGDYLIVLQTGKGFSNCKIIKN